jgi:hypothetical protein
MGYEVLGIVTVLHPSRRSWSFQFSSGVLCFSSPLAYISVPVWVSCLCPFSLRAAAI